MLISLLQLGEWRDVEIFRQVEAVDLRGAAVARAQVSGNRAAAWFHAGLESSPVLSNSSTDVRVDQA